MVDSPTMKKSFTISDIKPLDLYDSTRAKICASVGWLLGKSYGSAGRFGAGAAGLRIIRHVVRDKCRIDDFTLKVFPPLCISVFDGQDGERHMRVSGGN